MNRYPRYSEPFRAGALQSSNVNMEQRAMPPHRHDRTLPYGQNPDRASGVSGGGY